MIARLPHWVLTDRSPAFYDSESKTVVEMTAKIYAKMQELVDDYNKFVDPLNQEIADFYKDLEEKFECMKANLIKIQHDYILTVDEKMKMQDLVIKQFEDYVESKMKEHNEYVKRMLNQQDNEIQNAVDYMKTNIKETTQEVASELLQNGKISVNHTYFSTNKKLLLVISNSGVTYDETNKQVNIITRMEV